MVNEKNACTKCRAENTLQEEQYLKVKTIKDAEGWEILH